jgi:hypothetical protein
MKSKKPTTLDLQRSINRTQQIINDQKLPRLARVTSPTHVKRIALEYARAKRAYPFKRVSQSFLNAVEANARAFILYRVEKHPSRGVTLT